MSSDISICFYLNELFSQSTSDTTRMLVLKNAKCSICYRQHGKSFAFFSPFLKFKEPFRAYILSAHINKFQNVTRFNYFNILNYSTLFSLSLLLLSRCRCRHDKSTQPLCESTEMPFSLPYPSAVSRAIFIKNSSDLPQGILLPF